MRAPKRGLQNWAVVPVGHHAGFFKTVSSDCRPQAGEGPPGAMGPPQPTPLGRGSHTLRPCPPRPPPSPGEADPCPRQTCPRPLLWPAAPLRGGSRDPHTAAEDRLSPHGPRAAGPRGCRPVAGSAPSDVLLASPRVRPKRLLRGSRQPPQQRAGVTREPSASGGRAPGGGGTAHPPGPHVLSPGPAAGVCFYSNCPRRPRPFSLSVGLKTHLILSTWNYLKTFLTLPDVETAPRLSGVLFPSLSPRLSPAPRRVPAGVSRGAALLRAGGRRLSSWDSAQESFLKNGGLTVTPAG